MSNNKKNVGLKSEAAKKFDEAKLKMQKSVEKHKQNYESSEEEEEIESTGIVEAILKNYTGLGGGAKDLGRTERFLEELFISGATVCLICIASVKRIEPIWTCVSCYTFFHLNCIQRWSKDSIIHQRRVQEDQNPLAVKEFYNWYCPKCRNEYSPESIPTYYQCFCSKQRDPPYHPWLPPHSCGENCGKYLIPNCGHKCLLLCHPGPCPPCPKTINITCCCGKKRRSQRCSDKYWNCGMKCDEILSCGRHNCTQNCHVGDCQSCPKTSQQKCECGRETAVRQCATPKWHCKNICNRLLSCGNHKCEVYCHSGDCEECPLTKSRRCPCGKKEMLLPCIEETPNCGDTCDKILECGMHKCLQRCHPGKCGNCLEVVLKTCRCGLHKKELNCQKGFLCETKCKQIKDCQKHPCNRKCCDGNCPPCEKPCGRGLTCGIHKCNSTCHRGPCYPCRLTATIKCRCGGTTITVPCGRQKKTKPPRCNKSCTIPPNCHHPTRESHKCHFGDCPSCKQICNKIYEKCEHRCIAVCHSSVLIKIVDTEKVSMPWEKRGPHVERKCLPCPDCTVPISVTCLGGHETVDLPCYRAIKSSCFRPCGQLLACTNHSCSLECHQIGSIDGDNSNSAAIQCEKCESKCLKPRPTDCNHLCPKNCHPGECPPCNQTMRVKCYCGLNQIYIRCYEWTDTEKRNTIKSCGNQCPKMYTCGHRCTSTCHQDQCPDADQCRKKVKITCECKRLKREFRCDTVRAGKARIECDEECHRHLQQINQQKYLEEIKLKEEQNKKNQKELEEFQKKFQTKKKYREKKQIQTVEQQSFLKRYWFCIPIIVSVILGIYFISK